MKTSIDHKVQLYSAVFLVIVGAGLLISGFCVEPTGKIDNTVLIAFGEIMTFAGSIFGVDYTYKYRHSKIEVKHHENTEGNQK